jgi:hypothetical protein
MARSDVHSSISEKVEDPTTCGQVCMALGVFTSAGGARLRVQREAGVDNLVDLLLHSFDDLAAIAAVKGGIRQLLAKETRSGARSRAALTAGCWAGTGRQESSGWRGDRVHGDGLGCPRADPQPASG